MNLTTSWCFWALLSAFLAALTAVFAKVGLKDVDSLPATVISTLVIIVVLGICLTFGGHWPKLFEQSSKTWLLLALSGAATAASWLCYFRALKMGDASKVAPVDKFSFVLVVLLAVAFLGERPAVRDWVGIALMGTGVLVLATKSG
jgi:bacterial/archaeal transporter family protein